jgi:hypothetical protein
MIYNGVDIQMLFYNGWNTGIRLTLYPFFPMVQRDIFRDLCILNC